jgi:deoxyribodipyrimidine photo-lyase
MRQLAAEGWMHNRGRLVVASFLVKDLLVDWRRGETVFMQGLIDGDPANNNGGWQWTAGTGTDAAPYFRVMSPTRQGERFDPDGEYVRRWVPELRDVPAKLIHEPWRMGDAEQRTAGCRIGTDYPEPRVDHAERRRRVVELYEQARERAAAG